MNSTLPIARNSMDPIFRNSVICGFRNEISSYLEVTDLNNAKRVSKVFYQATKLKDYNRYEAQALKREFLSSVGYNPKCFRCFLEFINDGNVVIQDSSKKVSRNLGRLVLPSGKEVESIDFLENPLFCNAKEKESVFIELLMLVNHPCFLSEYKIFLSNKNNMDWFVRYQKKPIQLAHLSVLAFLDGEIDQDELFIVHTVASAYSELNSESSGEKVKVIKVEPRVVLPHDLFRVLTEFDVPPFEKENLIVNRKSNEEIFGKMQEFTDEYAKRSTIKKTFLTYTLSDFVSGSKKESVEMNIYFRIEVTSFFKESGGDRGQVLLPPWELVWKLFCITSKFEDRLKKPKPSFGHVNSYKVLLKRRPVTIPSSKFLTVRPHEFEYGPSGLGMFLHDFFHLLLEANNPHVGLLIEIGKNLIGENYLELFPNSDQKAFRRFAIDVLDREAVPYVRNRPYGDSFWEFLKTRISLKLVKKISDEDLIKYIETVLFPTIERSLKRYERKEKINDLIPVMKYAPNELLKQSREKLLKVNLDNVDLSKILKIASKLFQNNAD